MDASLVDPCLPRAHPGTNARALTGEATGMILSLGRRFAVAVVWPPPALLTAWLCGLRDVWFRLMHLRLIAR